MNCSIDLWVRLKVIDLVAQTAWMTLTEKLDFESDLCGIIRYSYWGMEAEGESAGSILAEVDRVVRVDSAFTNQNKHFYSLSVHGGSELLASGDLDLDGDFPVRKIDGSDPADKAVFACDLLVREKSLEREKGFTSRLNARLDGVKVTGMKAGEVWRILVMASSEEEAAGKVKEMAVTRSRREGLLLNPHYQKYEFLGKTVVCGRKEQKS